MVSNDGASIWGGEVAESGGRDMAEADENDEAGMGGRDDEPKFRCAEAIASAMAMEDARGTGGG